ncbi:guanylyl cyclase 1 [Physcomitrium patens]|uniref:Guanylyl cyclase n=1 Tax=Physcomitrium patens TaxID=3218 RepID=A0A2K1IXB1_PHYPA|nr:protein GUCD1-like [Physcomitrium patens]PNR33920.1 hypothetical protein PHYPA_023736 [Physcomitrium patens]|eukprot:XP_024403500.1 protein GUCD1-like [Physcomitrella patens]
MEIAVAGRATRVRPPRPAPETNGLSSSSQSVSHSGSSGWVAASLIESNVWSTPPTPLMDLSTPVPRTRSIQVPHVRQLCNWDCGLACVLMVLKFLGIQGCDLKYLSQLCQTTSIWTVDLAHLLRHFKVDVAFLTVTIGANPSFAVETFYQGNMEEDGERVNMLFAKAPQVGIRVQWRSITGEELSLMILSGGFLAIALVDKRKLSHPWLDELCLADCCGLNTGYTGHYVVICGYDMDADEFEIRDPASGSTSERISLDALDEARKAFGTDEDILLISLNKPERDSHAAAGKLSVNCSEKIL